MKIKLVGFLIFLISLPVKGLVPVEGIILGDVPEDLQIDPLEKIFSASFDRTQAGENKKIKLYRSTIVGGQELVESCSYLQEPVFGSVWQEKQAQRSMVATLQYLGLDTAIKAVGAYARNLSLTDQEFKTLSKNLVQNYCSKNLTVISLKSVQKALEYYYSNPPSNIIPSIQSSPFAPETVKNSTEAPSARSREFDLAIRNFRSLCSWGGKVEDYRMLTPYLANPYIMAFVIKNLSGLQDMVKGQNFRVETKLSSDTVQVVCTDFICRKSSLGEFERWFPTSVGSTGIATDLRKLYCHHFRYQVPRSEVPQVKDWVKSLDLEDPILETSQMIALMTGVPDFFNSVEVYRELPVLLRSSIDERWSKWAKSVLASFSRDLLYEEALKIRVSPRRSPGALATKGFGLDLMVTLGEMDRLLDGTDKLTVKFNLDLTKNYLRAIKTKWIHFENEVDLEGQKALKEEIARYLDHQLDLKEKYLKQKVWNEDFGTLIAEELIQQLKSYRGPLFRSYKDEVLKIPVKFSYGLFALSYLKYRADVAHGRLKLTL